MFEDTTGMDSVHCSFCGKSQDEVKNCCWSWRLYLCNECVESCKQIIDQELAEDEAKKLSVPTPGEIVNELDDYVIGQGDAKNISSCCL